MSFDPPQSESLSKHSIIKRKFRIVKVPNDVLMAQVSFMQILLIL